jgi:archaellum component FlaC
MKTIEDQIKESVTSVEARLDKMDIVLLVLSDTIIAMQKKIADLEQRNKDLDDYWKNIDRLHPV